MAWVRSTSSDHQAPPPPSTPLPSVPDQPTEGASVLFDSGTESGEDSTTQSNHSQSDLTSFMANLKLRANVVEGEPSLPPDPPDFLKQVDSILDRLKSSLSADESVERTAGPPASQQEMLNNFIASGGLEQKQPWSIHPDQQSELIGLIDRLQVSLHHLQRQSCASSATTSVAATPEIGHCTEPSATVPTTSANSTATASTSSVNSETCPTISTTSPPSSETCTTSTTSLAVTTTSPSAITIVPPTTETSPTTISTTTTNTPSPSLSLGLSAVKMRAKTFSTPRPESRSSWRSSSEPSTPSASPVPPKVHWKTPDFLKSGGTTSTTVSHRPIWCQRQQSQTSSNGDTTAPPPVLPSKIVLEKSAIRGRFVHQPELVPAPKFTPKAVVPAKLPSFLLNRVPQPKPAAVTSPPKKVSPVKTPSFDATKLVKQEDNPPPHKADTPPSTETPVLQIRTKAFSPVKSPTDKSPTLDLRRAKTVSPVRTAVLAEESEKKGDLEEDGTGRKSRSREVPWKVKLAKKKAERSQTTSAVSLDGSVSIDLRKSIQQAAHRKSLEDVHAEEAEPQRKVGMPHPMLKQKSLGELYAPKPKPFLSRSESLGRPTTSSSIPDPSPLRAWNRTSSLDRQDSLTSATASDAEPGTPVITAAIAPSPSGHNWVLSTVSSGGRAPLRRQEATETQVKADSIDGEQQLPPPPPEQVVTGILKLPAAGSSKAPDDPSQELFTPAESIQIAVHKAAINKQIWAEEARRRGVTESGSQESNPLTQKASTHPALGSLKQQFSLPDSVVLRVPPSPPAAVKSSPPLPVTAVPGGDEDEKRKTTSSSAAVWNSQRDRARRSNTIQLTIPAPGTNNPISSSGLGNRWRPVEAPNRTSGSGFLPNKVNNPFAQHSPSTSSGGVNFQPRRLGNNLRATFESAAPAVSPNRSRRSSAEDNSLIHPSAPSVLPDPSVAITSANLRVQLNSGSYSMASSAPVKPSARESSGPTFPANAKPQEPIHVKLTVNNQHSVVLPQTSPQPDPSAMPQKQINMAVSTKAINPAFRRLQRLERSTSSVQSSLRSDSAPDDDDDDAADDEASLSSCSCSSSSSVSDPAEVRLEPDDSLPSTVTTQSGMKHLSRMLHKYSDAPSPTACHHLVKSSSHDVLDKPVSRLAPPPAPTVNLIPPTPTTTLTPLRHSQSSSAMLFPTTTPSAEHYVDPSGPTLVGLVAKNVIQQQMRRSPTSLSEDVITNPANQLMKSVSGSRIVSQAAQKIVQQSTSHVGVIANRPRSLILLPPPETSPMTSPGTTRRASPSAVIVGTKQYEAALSPESAEKKQREIMQFFSSAKVGQQQSVSPSRPTVVRQESSQSDVDETFDILVAEASLTSPEVVQPASNARRANPFADRRLAWESSMGVKMHLNNGSRECRTERTTTTTTTSSAPKKRKTGMAGMLPPHAVTLAQHQISVK